MFTYLERLFLEKITNQGIIMSITSEYGMRFLTDCQRVKRIIEAFKTLEQTEHDSFSFLPLEHFILCVNKSYTRVHDTVSHVYEQSIRQTIDLYLNQHYTREFGRG